MKPPRHPIPFLLFALSLLLPSFACTQSRSITVEAWETRINKRQPPIEVMDAVGFRPGMVVGEVGAGRGRMTVWIADRIGDEGRIYANDIDAEALDKLRARCERDGFENVEIVLGEPEDPKLPENALDVAFMINVYHHVENIVPLLKNLRPSLKPDAYFAIVECDPAKAAWGEDHGCASRATIEADLAEAGFELVRVEDFLKEDGIYIARPKEAGL